MNAVCITTSGDTWNTRATPIDWANSVNAATAKLAAFRQSTGIVDLNNQNDVETQALDALEQQLLVLEDQLFSALQAFTPAEKLLAFREMSSRELAPYRSRLQTVQIRQIEQQFLRRCLFEQNRLPRLSLFYMRHI